jgi:uncharacterized protein (DUF934 family)
MPLLKAGGFVADPWRALDDAEPVAEDGPVTVSFARWMREREVLRMRNGAVGLRLPNDASPAALAPDLDRFGAILLSFPRFTDGRAYSQARLLRGRLGFRGELRIDAFALDERAVVEDGPSALGAFDVFYQPAADGSPWAMRRRLDAGTAAPR